MQFLGGSLYRPLFNSGVRRYPPRNWGVLSKNRPFFQFSENPGAQICIFRGGPGFWGFLKNRDFRVFWGSLKVDPLLKNYKLDFNAFMKF